MQVLLYDYLRRDALDYKTRLQPSQEKGSLVVSSSRNSILDIDLVRRVFEYIRANFGCWAMNSDLVEKHDMMFEVARIYGV